uniref:Bone morphogenetic protein 3 n=1 Tax=Callorhinchus milii TaxID=7868 RepID=V9KUY6_CALMI
MGSLRTLVFVCVGWSCCGLGFSEALREGLRGLSGMAGPGGGRGDPVTPRKPPSPKASGLLRDTVSEHMLMLYTKYKDSGYQLKDGNTVRSYKAHLGNIGDKALYIFNLTSLTKSEDVLSATLHYFVGDLVNSSGICPYAKGCSRYLHRKQVNVHLSIWGFASTGNETRTLGHYMINTSTLYRDFLSWQWKDITQVVNNAKLNDDLLIGIEITSTVPRSWKQLLSNRSPYILVYANDNAISELDTVVGTLQKQQGSFVAILANLGMSVTDRIPETRKKRSTHLLMPLHNNELPGAEYQYNEDATSAARRPYKKIHRRPADRQRKGRQRKGSRQKPQTLQFDEQTLRKARRRQWIEPRNCTRRDLIVDFADIGWNEWIISPKSFDAYYCAGACQFPMPQSLRPSNHATIQSIVRAVGVVPGIPEPCCVPEEMSPIVILFMDENEDVILKSYPNMKVESCACR